MKKYLHILNSVVCVVLAIVTIKVVLNTWSEYGDLTAISWLAAITLYGGLFYMLHRLIKKTIIKFVK